MDALKYILAGLIIVGLPALSCLYLVIKQHVDEDASVNVALVILTSVSIAFMAGILFCKY